uniref:Uncharacterized protein n=1 Tax=Cannabis sativa TaxID=3483 RepID=A0A803PZW4_CANSA
MTEEESIHASCGSSQNKRFLGNRIEVVAPKGIRTILSQCPNGKRHHRVKVDAFNRTMPSTLQEDCPQPIVGKSVGSDDTHPLRVFAITVYLDAVHQKCTS